MKKMLLRAILAAIVFATTSSALAQEPPACADVNTKTHTFQKIYSIIDGPDASRREVADLVGVHIVDGLLNYNGLQLIILHVFEDGKQTIWVPGFQKDVKTSEKNEPGVVIETLTFEAWPIKAGQCQNDIRKFIQEANGPHWKKLEVIF